MENLSQLTIDEHLRLRLPVRVDTQPLFELVKKNKAHLHHWRTWLSSIQTLKEMQAYIDTNTRDFHTLDVGITRQAGFNYLIILDEVIVGMVGFQGINLRNKITALGYWISNENEGKGIVTKAVKKIIQVAFDELRMNRIEIQCELSNLRSQKVAERLGFVKEAILHEVEYDETGNSYLDHVLYRLLRREYKPYNG